MNCGSSKRIILIVIYIFVGSALLALSTMGKVGDLWAGFGSGLLFIGLLQLLRRIRYKKDLVYKEKVDIEISDERNRFIRMKAWSWAGYLFVLLGCTATIACMIMGKDVLLKVSSYSVCTIIILYWVSYLVIKRKY